MDESMYHETWLQLTFFQAGVPSLLRQFEELVSNNPREGRNNQFSFVATVLTNKNSDTKALET